ncbi:MAG: protein kinase [Planctomycetota bacterium]
MANASSGLPRLGGYELIGKVGKGGMGNVFKARQISMDRIVALKVLSSQLAKDDKFVARFHREAKAAAKLSHMNIIQSIDVGEEDGYHYFAMEYVQGPTVDDLLQKSKVLKEDFCLDIICQTARAIQAAEKLGIIHFDIKPSNIMITKDRIAKLADFGLARRVERTATRAKQGLVFGTPEYMSPEQALGKPDVDSRSDIYSLGVSFYQMVTGRLPFEGKTPRETVDLRLTGNPIPAKQLNPALSNETCQIIDRMLARDRNQRYQTAAELIEDLEYVTKQRSGTTEAQAAAGMQIDIPPEELEAVEQTRYAPRRRKIAGPIFGFIMLVALGGGVFYVVRYRPDLIEKVQKDLNITIGAPKPQPVEEGPKVVLPENPKFVPKDLSSSDTVGKAGEHRIRSKQEGPSHPKAKDSYRQIMDMRKTHLMQNDFKGVLKAYDYYPDNYKFAVEWKQLEEQKKKDLEDIKVKFKTQNDAMGALVAADKIGEALDLAKKIEERFPEDILKEAEFEKKKQQLQGHLAKQEKAGAAKKQALLTAYRDAAGPAYKMALQGQYDKAKGALDELMVSPDFADVQNEIKKEKKDIDLLNEYMDAVYAGGKELQGKKFKVGGIGSTLVSVEDGVITIQMAGKEKAQPLADLKPDELNQLAQKGGFTTKQSMGDLHLRSAIFYHFAGKMGEATMALLKAQEEGTNIDAYRSWLSK